MHKKVEKLTVISVGFLVCIRVLPEPPLEQKSFTDFLCLWLKSGTFLREITKNSCNNYTRF